MRIFAVELSSRFGSIALVENGAVVAEKTWGETFKNRQQLFDAMSALHMDWQTVDAFAVGRGPGAFSGMRIAFSVANSLAAQDRQPVYALSSGAAVAARCGAEYTAVVGDARRSQIWAGVFKGVELEKDFELMALAELQDFIPEGVLVASPDHDRLEAGRPGHGRGLCAGDFYGRLRQRFRSVGHQLRPHHPPPTRDPGPTR